MLNSWNSCGSHNFDFKIVFPILDCTQKYDNLLLSQNSKTFDDIMKENLESGLRQQIKKDLEDFSDIWEELSKL